MSIKTFNPGLYDGSMEKAKGTRGKYTLTSTMLKIIKERDALTERCKELQRDMEGAVILAACLDQALDPRRWTQQMHHVWHKNLPDTNAAFMALREVAKHDTQPPTPRERE